MQPLTHPRSVFIIALLFSAVAIDSVRGDEKPKYDTFDAKGVKIRYSVLGKGEPVVLIHGLHASGEINWVLPGITAALAKDHQVVALDLPGHGGSDKPKDEDAYGTRMVDDVLLLMDHLEIKKAHIVGYSLGGMIALKLIAEHPDRALSGTLGGMGWMKEGGVLQKFWERLPAKEDSRTPPACINSIGKLAITEAQLKAIKTPMIVLIGDRDPVKQMYVAPLQAVRKDWTVVEIPNAGHLICIFKKEFTEELVKWVEKNGKK